MNLCIDIGNTSIKAALFEKATLKEKHTFEEFESLKILGNTLKPDKVIISSVRGDESSFLQNYFQCPVTTFKFTLNLPVLNKYKTPETLGKDRLASVIGAKSIFPATNCLVIDAGTCVTYDILNKHGEYLGGAISPGLSMRYRALNHFTAKLPLLVQQEDMVLIGHDTTTSIISGVQNGMLFEIDKTIEEYRLRFPDLHVILCGGDSPFFESKIKGTIFAFPDLVLIGLNHTLLYNAS